ncbi:MAG: phosphatidylinositol kinase, partial [Ilumatobacteraceae bacterium]
LGEGSLQWFVDADHREHYFTIHEQRPDLHGRLRAIAALDIVANNTDRKSGHCLLSDDGVWAIDNGLCFAEEFKLRTVIWEFAGEPLPESLVDRLRRLVERVPLNLAALLSEPEVDAMVDRTRALLDLGELPHDETGRRYPWPLI